MSASSSGLASSSNLTKSQLGKLRMGSGARQKRCDKYRYHMNEIFENKRMAALNELLQDFNTKRFSDTVHDAMVGKKPTDSITDCAVEIDETQIEERVHFADFEIELLAIKHSGKGFQFPTKDGVKWYQDSTVYVNETTVTETNTQPTVIEPPIQEVSVEDEDHMCTPESPVYVPDSPQHSEDVLASRTYEGCVIVSDVEPQPTPSDKVTPVRLHPLKYSLVVLTYQEHPNLQDLDEYLDNIPYDMRCTRRLHEFVPRVGCVFRTKSERLALYLHRKGCGVLAHIPPYGLRKLRGIKINTHKLQRAGVLTFVSVNNLATDISVCGNMMCLHEHRGIRNRGKNDNISVSRSLRIGVG